MSKFDLVYNSIGSLKDVSVYKNLKIAPYTSFKIGGRVKLFIKVGNNVSLKKIIQTCNKFKVKWFCMGNASNLLITDSTINMAFIQLDNEFNKIECSKNKLICGAKSNMFCVNAQCVKNSLSGLEWSYGIPGSIGGAVVMNAGSFGGEMKQVVDRVYYTDGYKDFCITNKYINFKYRDSFFKGKQYVITKVILKLNYGDDKKIWLDSLANFDKKKSTQPYDKPSAGSVFKRVDNTPAPILIEKSNLKGKKIGDAQISNKHCGFIVNNGRAKSKQVFKLIYKIKKTIYKKFGIMLHSEIIYIGDKKWHF